MLSRTKSLAPETDPAPLHTGQPLLSAMLWAPWWLGWRRWLMQSLALNFRWLEPHSTMSWLPLENFLHGEDNLTAHAVFRCNALMLLMHATTSSVVAKAVWLHTCNLAVLTDNGHTCLSTVCKLWSGMFSIHSCNVCAKWLVVVQNLRQYMQRSAVCGLLTESSAW